ncbi:MAG: hypothetical protein J5733_10115, partial [Bacteroidaceae bacterium]|nr:hypothetical protein [Bacteroidaceae bacterium]
MKRKTILFALVFVQCSMFNVQCSMAQAQPLCIPGVQEMKSAQGTVEVSKFVTVTYDNPSLASVADYLNKAWENTNSTSLRKKISANSIFLSIKPDKKLGDEGYRLTIN